MQKKIFRFLLPVLFFTLSIVSAFGQETKGDVGIGSWFNNSRQAKPYNDIKEPILSLFARSEQRGVPSSLLLDKLKEGAAKRIPEQRLLAALSQELDRLTRAQQIIESTGYEVDVEGTEYKEHLKLIVIMIRGGLSEIHIQNVLEFAEHIHKPLTAGIAACEALLQLNQIATLQEEQLLDVGKALLDSSLPTSGYASVTSIFIKARALKIRDKETVAILQRVLDQGGGLIQLEREINRRGRRR